MSLHQVTLQWTHAPHPLEPTSYSRNHVVMFDGKQSLDVSASLEFRGDALASDPEQMVVGALASCHMLTFLAVAEARGYVVASYEDNARGMLEKREGAGLELMRIDLAPRVLFGGEGPDAEGLGNLHKRAHKNCIIANSIKAKVVITPRS